MILWLVVCVLIFRVRGPYLSFGTLWRSNLVYTCMFIRHSCMQSVNNVILWFCYMLRRYYNQSGRVYISVLEHCRKRKFRTFLHLTLISKIFMMSQLSGLVVCSTNLYIWGLYLRFRTSFEIEIQYVNSSDPINTIFNHCHAWVISENVIN